jgi:RNA polymerase-binding transcription factor DksA
MAERTGIATKLARVLGGGGSRGGAGKAAERDSATPVGKDTEPAPPAKAPTAKATATKKAAKKAGAKAPAKAAKEKITSPKATAGTTARAATARTPAQAATARTPAQAATARTPAQAAAKATKSTRPAARGAGTSTTKATTASMTTKTATKATKARPATGDEDYTELRDALVARAAELRGEHDRAMADINDLQRDRIADGAGDDQADAGTKTFEREQEISLANGILDRLTQVERALDRLDAGTYGRCERCGNAIPKARLEAFPSVTLCVACKQIEERR